MNKYLSVIILVFSITELNAQVNDAGLWASLNVEKKVTQKFALHFSEEVRLNENFSEIGTVFSELTLEYKFTDYFSASGGYRFILKKQVEDYWSKRHRMLFNLNAKQKFGKVGINARFRFQSQYADYNSSADGKVAANHLRTKLSAKLDLAKKYTPFISGESFFHLNHPDGVLFDNYRVSAGFEYEFNKRASIELFYMIDREVNVNNPITSYIIGVGYNYIF